MRTFNDYVKKGWARPITEFERLCGEFAKMFVEDIQKFGRIDKDGTMWIDDGIQKMMVGRCK